MGGLGLPGVVAIGGEGIMAIRKDHIRLNASYPCKGLKGVSGSGDGGGGGYCYARDAEIMNIAAISALG